MFVGHGSQTHQWLRRTFLSDSSALSVLWNDTERAIHPLPATSRREGNNEAQEEPGDTQVELSSSCDPIHLNFSVLWLNILFNSFLVFIFIHALSRLVFWFWCLVVVRYCFFFHLCFSISPHFSHCCLCSCCLLPLTADASWHLSFVLVLSHAHVMVFCFLPLSGESMFRPELLRNTLNFLTQ